MNDAERGFVGSFDGSSWIEASGGDFQFGDSTDFSVSVFVRYTSTDVMRIIGTSDAAGSPYEGFDCYMNGGGSMECNMRDVTGDSLFRVEKSNSASSTSSGLGISA